MERLVPRHRSPVREPCPVPGELRDRGLPEARPTTRRTATRSGEVPPQPPRAVKQPGGIHFLQRTIADRAMRTRHGADAPWSIRPPGGKAEFGCPSHASPQLRAPSSEGGGPNTHPWGGRSVRLGNRIGTVHGASSFFTYAPPGYPPQAPRHRGPVGHSQSGYERQVVEPGVKGPFELIQQAPSCRPSSLQFQLLGQLHEFRPNAVAAFEGCVQAGDGIGH